MNTKQLILIKHLMNFRPMIHAHSAFTLAEVLITLVIIGVIAAMTVPTLMNNTNSQEYRTGIKKAISTLNQALTMQYAMDGTRVSDFAGIANIRNSIFMQRLSVIKTSDTAYNFNNTGGTLSSSTIFYTADGMKFGLATNAAGCDAAGTLACWDLYIDTNGDRQPNTLTATATKPLDVYQATIYAQRIIPWGAATQGVMYESKT